MKSKLKDLDVDFIGGQSPLTKEEENRISEYLNSHGLLNAKRKLSVKKTSRRKKDIA